MISVVALALLTFQDTKPLTPSTLIVDSLAIATYENKKWTPCNKPLSIKKAFSVHRLDIGRVAETTAAFELEFLDGIEGNFLSDSHLSDVLWSGPFPKYPRSIRILNPEQNDYKILINDYVKTFTKSTPKYKIRIDTIARVDLDGDGQEEALIQASSDSLTSQYSFEPDPKGQMSCTLLRHVKNGKAVTEPIFFFHKPATSKVDEPEEPIQITRLKAIADLNGDGNFEIIVTADYYEGQSASVYNLEKGVLKKLVEHGAGV